MTDEKVYFNKYDICYSNGSIIIFKTKIENRYVVWNRAKGNFETASCVVKSHKIPQHLAAILSVNRIPDQPTKSMLTSLMILTSSLTRPGRLFCNNSGPIFAIGASYNEEENRNYNYGYSPYCDCGELVYNNGVVESLTPKKPVRLATTEMLNNYATTSYVDTKIGDIETILHNINSGS